MYLGVVLLVLGVIYTTAGVYSLFASRFSDASKASSSAALLSAQFAASSSTVGVFMMFAYLELSEDRKALETAAAVVRFGTCVLQPVATLLQVADAKQILTSLLGGALVLGAALVDLNFSFAAACASEPLLAALCSFVLGLILTLTAAMLSCRKPTDDDAPFIAIDSHYQLSPASRALLSAK